MPVAAQSTTRSLEPPCSLRHHRNINFFVISLTQISLCISSLSLCVGSAVACRYSRHADFDHAHTQHLHLHQHHRCQALLMCAPAEFKKHNKHTRYEVCGMLAIPGIQSSSLKLWMPLVLGEDHRGFSFPHLHVRSLTLTH